MSFLRKDRRCFGCKKYLHNSECKHEIQPDEVPTMQKCSSCDTASFCTAECLKLNWGSHKKVCLRMKSLREDLKVFQDDQIEYFDRRVSMAYAMWHLVEVSDNYVTCEKFCDFTEELILDENKYMDDKEPTKLIYYLIFGYLKLGIPTKAYFCLKTSIIQFLLFVGKRLKNKKVKEAKVNVFKNDLTENIIQVTEKILNGFPYTVWKNYWQMLTVTFLPGMIATKLHVILTLMEGKEDAKNLAEVCNSEDGGMLYELNNKHPIIIQRIKWYLFGFDTHREFQSVLRQQKSDLKEYIEHGKMFCFLRTNQLLDYDSKHEHCEMLKNGTFLEFDSESEHEGNQEINDLATPMEESAESYFQALFKSNSNAQN